MAYLKNKGLSTETRIMNMRIGGIGAFVAFYYDIYTDYSYIINVRWHSDYLRLTAVFILALPLVLITIWCVFGIVTYQEDKVINHFIGCFVRFTGSGDIYYAFNPSAKFLLIENVCFLSKQAELDENLAKEQSSIIYVPFEQLPELVVQTYNTLMIGSTLTFS